MIGAGLLVVGVVVGAGLIFGTLYATGSLSARTVTQTLQPTTVSSVTQTYIALTVNHNVTTTVTTTVTSTPFGSFTSSPQLSAGAVSCVQATTHINCTFLVTNTGSADGAIQISGAVLNYADATLGAQNIQGVLDNGAFGTASTAPQSIAAGGSGVTVLIQYTMNTGYGGPVSGTSFSGSLPSSSGGSILYSGSY